MQTLHMPFCCTFYANVTKEAHHFNLSFSSHNVVHSVVKTVLILWYCAPYIVQTHLLLVCTISCPCFYCAFLFFKVWHWLPINRNSWRHAHFAQNGDEIPLISAVISCKNLNLILAWLPFDYLLSCWVLIFIIIFWYLLFTCI